jgi:hypothetical protein
VLSSAASYLFQTIPAVLAQLPDRFAISRPSVMQEIAKPHTIGSLTSDRLN